MSTISKGLLQSYILQDIAFEAITTFKENRKDPLSGKVAFSPEDAKAFATLVASWKIAQERISFHRRVPSPGVLRPESGKKRKAKGLSTFPIAQLLDSSPQSLLPSPQALDSSDQSPDSAIQ